MTQHYQRNVKQAKVYCNTCRKLTMHRVEDRRLGPCLEHGVEGLSRKQQKRQQEQEEAKVQPVLEGL